MDKLIEETLKNIDYTVINDVLVKTLTPVKVNKIITEQVPTGEKDENGYEMYDTKDEEKEVESDWSIGVVLCLPKVSVTEHPFTVGDTVVYNKKFARDFDLIRNTNLVRPYDIVAIYNRK